MIGSGGKTHLHPPITDGSGDFENRRVKTQRSTRKNSMALEVKLNQLAISAGQFAHEEIVSVGPLDPCRRGGPSLRQIARLPPIRRDDPDVAARRALIAHQAADECNSLSIRRPAWDRDLQPV